MLNGDADGFADLFAPDPVMEFCFHGPPSTPVRLEGREAIREYSRRVTASPIRIEDFEVTDLCQAQDRRW
jgi:ketosteroid isomerase-like protein